VLVVLFGDLRTRDLYLRDPGRNPAVALNHGGQVIEVHDSGPGDLWYWTGRMDPFGQVTWLRHGRYDTGQTPAVAINDQGLIVEVHQSESATTLWYHAGYLGFDSDIYLSESQRYDNGVGPTVQFVDLNGLELIERHRSQSTGLGWTWDGTFDAGGPSVAWRGNRRTSEPLFEKTIGEAGGTWVSVGLGTDGDSLRYQSYHLPDGPIRYRQLAFVECQKGDESSLPCGDLQFLAASAGSSGDRAWGAARRLEGKLVRLWDFDDVGDATDPPVSFPATNQPVADWYYDYLRALGARE
jgi:hypothetical protein